MTYQETGLTLPVVHQLRRNRRGTPEPVEVIASELRHIHAARRRGAHRTALAHIDALIDFVWFSGPDDAS